MTTRIDLILKPGYISFGQIHRLNMELDFHSLHIWAPVYTVGTDWLRHRNSPLPPHLASYTRALLVSQDRRHLFITPQPDPVQNTVADVPYLQSVILTDDTHLVPGQYESLQVGPALYARLNVI
jgi:hypothetical protein